VTIRQLIERAQNGKDGNAGAWHTEIEKTDFGHETHLYHYTTRVLTWLQESPTNTLWLDWNLGWGSVSDQNGLNVAFRVLGLPLRYDRDQRGGGARVTDISEQLASVR